MPTALCAVPVRSVLTTIRASRLGLVWRSSRSVALIDGTSPAVAALRQCTYAAETL